MNNSRFFKLGAIVLTAMVGFNAWASCQAVFGQARFGQAVFGPTACQALPVPGLTDLGLVALGLVCLVIAWLFSAHRARGSDQR